MRRIQNWRAKLGIKSAHFNNGISGLKPESNPGQIMPLAQFYFPSINPSAAIDPMESSRVLFRNLQGEPVGTLSGSKFSAVLLGFPIESMKTNDSAKMLADLISRLGL